MIHYIFFLRYLPVFDSKIVKPYYHHYQFGIFQCSSKKSSVIEKKEERRDDSNWSMGYLETVYLQSQALRFY